MSIDIFELVNRVGAVVYAEDNNECEATRIVTFNGNLTFNIYRVDGDQFECLDTWVYGAENDLDTPRYWSVAQLEKYCKERFERLQAEDDAANAENTDDTDDTTEWVDENAPRCANCGGAVDKFWNCIGTC